MTSKAKFSTIGGGGCEKNSPLQISGSLFFGDNLDILRDKIKAESVDLVYLDPPFNSKADYNILFKTPDNIKSPSQITAFEDTWHWTSESELIYGQLLNADPRTASVIRGMREAIGENDMMAYLVMMTIRLIELHRILKPTGSLYLHCDPTASHYLKIILDAVFGPVNFKNEIVWHYQTGGASKKWFSKKHDIILFYSKSKNYNFNPERILMPRTEKSLRRAQNPKGARIASDDILKLPMDVWVDIQALNPMSSERMGYPTQKPLSLLERIIQASSNKEDVILDPFCGCGTAIEASQKLNRNWIGIDITHLAIGLIEKRMKDAFGITVKVSGTPNSFESAQDLARRNKFQFEAWAVTLIPNVLPNKKQVGDKGIDGRGYIQLGKDKNGKRNDAKIIVSVKGGDSLTPSMVRDLVGTMSSEKADLGVFICIKKPTRKMIEASAKAGLFETPLGQKYPKLQIYTIEDYFNRITPKLPSLEDFVKAPQSKTDPKGRQVTL